MMAAQWSAAHEGASPSIRMLTQIDRRAWAMSRTNKPTDLDEQSWEATVRDELEGIDPALRDRTPVAVVPTPLDALDLDLLADAAVIDADERSTRSGGRFRSFDLRAGAVRAVSERSGRPARRADGDDR